MPLPKDCQIVSVDDHVIEHKDAYKDRLPAEFADRGPKVVEIDGEARNALGNTSVGRQQVWMIDGEPYATLGLNAVVGKPKEQFGLEPTRFEDMRPGCYDIHERIKDMDADGIHVQLSFPSLPGFAGRTFFELEDKALALACVRASNDFMIDEWCAAYPDRQIPLAILPYWDVALSVAEIERVAAKGAKAISFIEAPHAVGLPSWHSGHWDPMLAAMQDADLPMCLHFGTGGAPLISPDANFAVAIALFGTNSQFAMAELLLSPVFHTFDRLRVALSEGGIGWMPYLLERLDYTWERHRFYAGCNQDVRPSDLFRDHIFGCFISDDAGIELRHAIGVENVMFEADYPHSDCNWPSSRVVLEKLLADVPDDEARKIAEDNARRIYNFPRR